MLLARAGDTTVLARKDTSTWTVNGHPAGRQAIADLFAALGDSAPGGELVAERRASHAALGVDSAGGTRVRVRGGGRTLADLVVGHRSSDFSGGYVRRADQEATWLARGRLVDVLTRPTDEWRDHRIASVTPDSVGAIEIARGSRRYVLKRVGAGWTLSPGGTGRLGPGGQPGRGISRGGRRRLRLAGTGRFRAFRAARPAGTARSGRTALRC